MLYWKISVDATTDFSLCLDVMLTCGLIVIDTDPVQLQITVSMVGPGGIDAMLITDHLPELRKIGVENIGDEVQPAHMGCWMTVKHIESDG